MNIPINIETLLAGKGTGIPTIKKVMETNGSPPAKYDTDGDERRFFVTELPVHPHFLTESELQDKLQDKIADGAHDKALNISEKEVLSFCIEPHSRSEILKELKFNTRTGYFKRMISKLLENELIEMVLPNTPKSKFQKYITTKKGRELIESLKGP